jgi:hypothetical protein
MIRKVGKHGRLVALAAIGLVCAGGLTAHADVTATWLSETSGKWSDPTHWSTNPSYPSNGTPAGTNYQAIIAATGGTSYTATLNTDVDVTSISINSADAELDQTSGTLQAGTINVNAGAYQMDSGTLVNTAIDINAGSLGIQDATLDGVTIQQQQPPGGIVLVFGNITVKNGLTVTGTQLFLLGGGSVDFDGAPQTISDATISGAYTAAVYASGPTSTGGQTLTLGANANFSNVSFPDYTSANGDSLVNNGTITSSQTEYYHTDIFVDHFTNNGLLQATSNGTVIISPTAATGSWQNSSKGTITAANNSYLEFDGSWSNAGTVTATNHSSVHLNGSFTTAAIGNITVSANSSALIGGDLDNSGATFKPGDFGGPCVLWLGGEIDNGTIDLSGNNFTVSSGTLNGVALAGGDLSVQNADFVFVKNGISGDGHAINLGSDLSFIGNQTISNLQVTGGAGLILADPAGSPTTQTLTLAKTASVNGQIRISQKQSGDTLINDGTMNFVNPLYGDAIDVDHIINNGTISFRDAEITTVDLTVNGTLDATGDINGNVTLSSDPSTLAFELATNDPSPFDTLMVNGNLTLGGNLQISLVDGYEPTNSDVLPILIVNSIDTLCGEFLNAPNGGRVETTDGSGSFLVNYGSGPDANEIILSDFQPDAVPEPTSAVAFGVMLFPLMTRRRKRAAQ